MLFIQFHFEESTVIAMEKIKIGYQGIDGSNTYTAVTRLASRIYGSGFELVPLVSSANVLSALSSHQIDLGLMATDTAVVGAVPETKTAMLSLAVPLKQIDEISLDIHHCLFALTGDSSFISRIASHPEALRECGGYLQTHFPHAELIPVEDTALSARKLAGGGYTPDTAIICSKKAGTDNHLSLLAENIEDLEHNWTRFRLYSTI